MGEKYDPGRWYTPDEISFLDGLGRRNGADRIGLLEKYRAAAETRHEWGKVDKAKVLKACDEMIVQEIVGLGRGRR